MKKDPQVIAVVGGQWGDEGKGKIVDFFAQKADVVIRSQGGDNAGHTVVNDQGKFALHLLPSGIFNPKCLNIIGSGVVLNPASLLSEIEALESKGVITKNLKISAKAHLIFDYHKRLDSLLEESRGGRKIGTTQKGIGPAYTDKAQRIGLQARLLKDPDKALMRIKEVLVDKARYFQNGVIPDEFKVEYYEEQIKKFSQALSALIVDVDELIQHHLSLGSTIILEGAQGTLLDIDHGTYPSVTSSNTTVGGLLVGAGIAPHYLTRSVGIFKAYQTRVGEGGMPTELKNEQGDLIRERGGEYGATTGRPRRIGYFDGVAAQYSQQINGFTDIAITRIDTLSDTGDLKICKAYSLNGEQVARFQPDDSILAQYQAEYAKEDQFKGWGKLGAVKSFDELPEDIQRYCRTIESCVPGAKLSFVGIGASREEVILL
jgi:adenylosuccinate synthase